MDRSGDGSVTHWLSELAEGGEVAQQKLWERYFDRLTRLAQAKYRRAGLPGDGEDAALSALHDFYQAARSRRFPDLRDRNNLWRLLVTIASRKVRDQLERQACLKRGGGRVIVGSAPDDQADAIENAVGLEPTPEFAAIVAEELRLRLDSLAEPQLRLVAGLRLEGYTIGEIAGRIGRSRRMVDVYLRSIRSAWGEGPSDDE